MTDPSQYLQLNGSNVNVTNSSVTNNLFANSATPPSGNSFTEKQLQITFILGQGQFGNTGNTQVVLNNLRVSAYVVKNGPDTNNSCKVRIWGVNPQIMDQVTLLGMENWQTKNNVIVIEAAEKGQPFSLVYKGIIGACNQDLNSQPETYLYVEAWCCTLNQLKPTTPISTPGSADVATMMAGIANNCNLTFENNGVQATITNPYYSGTASEQAKALAHDANIGLYIDDQVLAIYPINGARGGAIPLISPAAGELFYPTYKPNGLSFVTIFNPNIAFGKYVNIQSTYQKANGLWWVNQLVYELESQMPGGKWQCDVDTQTQAAQKQPDPVAEPVSTPNTPANTSNLNPEGGPTNPSLVNYQPPPFEGF